MFELVPWRRGRGSVDRPWTRDWMDRFLEELGPGFLLDENKDLVPAFDVSETENEIIVKADLPGIEAKDLDVSVSGNVLTVRGEKKKEEENEDENYHRVERRYGMFNRSIMLPADVKAESVDATYKDGVLRIAIPKVESARRKKIELKAE